MKSILAFFVSSLFFSVPALAALKTVDSVDLQAYLGTWYQIAAKPTFFQRGCYCSRQVLTDAGNGEVGVYNSCNKNSVNGPLEDIRGTATVADATTSAKLEVDFGFFIKGQYWIIGLDPQYRYAVVSDPRKITLYILSRTPELPKNLYDEAVALAATQLDTSVLVKTPQAGCEYPK